MESQGDELTTNLQWQLDDIVSAVSSPAIVNMTIPGGFTDLLAAYNAPKNTFVNLIGVVVDLMPPRQTTTGQHIVTFKIHDQQLVNSLEAPKGLTVRFFKQNLSTLPKVQKVGDIVLLRQIKMTTFNEQRIALSHYQTVALVFPSVTIPTPEFSTAFTCGDKKMETRDGHPFEVKRLTTQEQAYVVELKQAMSKTLNELLATHQGREDRVKMNYGAAIPFKSPKPEGNFGKKFHLIQELDMKMYADILGQVVKVFPTRYSSCDLYVTDYTANKQVWYYSPPEEEDEGEKAGDTFGYTGPPKKAWPGPYGFLVLKINVKPPHAQFASSLVREGDIVLLRNVKMRVTDVGTKLEGDMWPDDQAPDKVQIKKIMSRDTPEVEVLLHRKEDYWSSRATKANEIQPKGPGEVKKMSKMEKSKQKKKRQKERKTEITKSGDETESVEASPPPQVVNRGEVNRNVRCRSDNNVLCSVAEILDVQNTRHIHELPDGRSYTVPFANHMYRAKVRVVDYSPKALEDFSTVVLQDCDEEGNPELAQHKDPNNPRLEWYFQLHLEDARKPQKPGDAENNRVWVNVHHEQAQFLFGKRMDDPTDLRKNSKQLAKLKETMFILWGNLQEAGGNKPLSNLPFECCFFEYGIEVHEGEELYDPNSVMNWVRQYMMFGATIL